MKHVIEFQDTQYSKLSNFHQLKEKRKENWSTETHTESELGHLQEKELLPQSWWCFEREPHEADHE